MGGIVFGGSSRFLGAAFVVLALVMVASPPAAASGVFTQLWVSEAHMIMEGSPVVVDLDGDGDDEIVTAAYENLIAFDGDGKELWRFDARGRYSTCPAVLERPGASPLLFAGDNKGQFTCVDGAGKVVWQADMAPVFCAAPAIAYLRDGRAQIVQGDQSGNVNVLDALTGNPVWKHALEGQCSSVAIGDKNRDGNLDIVVATTTGKVFALDADGNVVWQYELGGATQDWATCSPILIGNSTSETRVVCASSQPRLICLDSKGAVAWDYATKGAIASTLSAGDFDGDGRADIFAITQLGVLYRFDEDGRVLWEIDTQGRTLAPGAIVDIDGDDRLDFVFSTQNGNLIAINADGEMAFNYQFSNRTINMTPVFGDILKDRPGLEFAVTGGESGRMYCFGAQANTLASAQWRTYRGDNHLTGAWFGLRAAAASSMIAENLDAETLRTTDTVRFRIETPKNVAGLLVADATVEAPGGLRRGAMTKVVGAQGALELPIGIDTAGVYRFSWSLRDDKGNRLATGSKALALEPYKNDRAIAAKAVIALRKVSGDMPPAANDSGVKAGLYAESAAIEQEAASLAQVQSDAGAKRSDVNARTEQLSQRALRALAIADAAQQTLSTAGNAQLIVFAGTTWENRGIGQQAPVSITSPLQFNRRCVPGEHETVSIKLLNPGLQKVAAGCTVSKAEGGPVATVYEVKSVPTNLGETAWDPIVPLGAGTVEIPPMETRELWIDLDAVRAVPGEYPLHATVTANAVASSVDIGVTVLPFQIAGYEQMRLCCWAQYNNPQAYADLLAHGNTVFIGGLPPVTVQNGDAATMKIDYTPLDAFVAPLQGADVFVMLSGIPALGPKTEDDAYVPLLKVYLDQVLAHLAGKGFDDKHVALYPYDEPGGNGWDVVKQFVLFGKQVLKARPGMNIYMDGGGDLPMYEAMAEVTSHWSPSFYMLPDDSPEMQVVRKSGKTLWSYDCGYGFSRPVGWNTKTINIVAQYRLAAVTGMHFGATGIGYWCYNHGDSMWDPVVAEFPLVYTNKDGSITGCRRWEAVREGMEDARILIALRDKLNDPAVSAEAKSKINSLIDGTVASTAKQTMEEARIGAARYVLDATNNDATVERLRAEMMDCVDLLAK